MIASGTARTYQLPIMSQTVGTSIGPTVTIIYKLFCASCTTETADMPGRCEVSPVAGWRCRDGFKSPMFRFHTNAKLPRVYHPKAISTWLNSTKIKCVCIQGNYQFSQLKTIENIHACTTVKSVWF